MIHEQKGAFKRIASCYVEVVIVVVVLLCCRSAFAPFAPLRFQFQLQAAGDWRLELAARSLELGAWSALESGESRISPRQMFPRLSVCLSVCLCGWLAGLRAVSGSLKEAVWASLQGASARRAAAARECHPRALAQRRT